MEPKGRDVLDTRFRGYDGGGWGSVIIIVVIATAVGEPGISGEDGYKSPLAHMNH